MLAQHKLFNYRRLEETAGNVLVCSAHLQYFDVSAYLATKVSWTMFSDTPYA